MKHQVLHLAVAGSLVLGAGSIARADDVAGIMVEGFGWNTPVQQNRAWWDHLSDLSPQLKKFGITAIWAPPATKASGGGFSDGYDLYDYYDLGSKNQCGTVATHWGTKEQFLQFVATAHTNGLDVYSDIEVNARAGGGNPGPYYPGCDFSHLVGAESTGRGTMGPWDFHPDNWQGDQFMRLCGLPDVNQENAATRQKLFDWIRWFDKQTDVNGYRIDAAKHMPTDFQEGLMYQVQEGMGSNRNRFFVGEYYDGNPDTLEWYVNACNRRTSVFDYQGTFTLHSMCHGNGYFDMRGLRSRFFDGERSVTFLNNHDTMGRGNGMDTFVRANLGYAVMMASPGYPCIYYPDLYDDQGNIRQYFYTACWVHAFLAHGAVIERWADDDLYVMERQGNLLAGFNDNTNNWRDEWVQTTFGPNVHLHDYSGQIPDRWTDNNGWVYISVPPSGYVFLGRDGLQGLMPNPPARRTTQETEGNADMDTPRAKETWSDPIKVVSDAGQPIHVDVYVGDKTLTPHVCLLDKDGNRLNHARGKNGAVSLDFANPSKAGWYQVRVGLEKTASGNAATPYWCKVNYQAPATLPDYKDYPDASKIDGHVLPLVSTSVGP